MMIWYINHSYQLYSLQETKEKGLKGGRMQQTEGEWRHKQQTSVQLQRNPALGLLHHVRRAGVGYQAIYA